MALDVTTALQRYLCLGYPEEMSIHETDHDTYALRQVFHVREQDGRIAQIGLVLLPKPYRNPEEDAMATHEIVWESVCHNLTLNIMASLMSSFTDNSCEKDECLYPIANRYDLETIEAEILRSRPVFVSALFPQSVDPDGDDFYSLASSYFACAAAMLLEDCQGASMDRQEEVSL